MRHEEFQYHVYEQLGQLLIVTDNNISGTFTFLRALSEIGSTPDLTPAQIGAAASDGFPLAGVIGLLVKVDAAEFGDVRVTKIKNGAWSQRCPRLLR